MLDHAFGFARAIWFDVGAGNLRSRRAMEKLGATLARETPANAATGATAHVHYGIERQAWLDGLGGQVDPATRKG
jgi:RimJ/RimL family protein N-acetyltransferase